MDKLRSDTHTHTDVRTNALRPPQITVIPSGNIKKLLMNRVVEKQPQVERGSWRREAWPG